MVVVVVGVGTEVARIGAVEEEGAAVGIVVSSKK